MAHLTGVQYCHSIVSQFMSADPAVLAARDPVLFTESNVRETQERIKESVQLIISSREKFNTQVLSFNGGKDCLVLLLLLGYACYEHPDYIPGNKINCIYFPTPHPFPQVTEFLGYTKDLYDLDIWTSPTNDMKNGLEEYLSKHPGVDAILLGTRLSDLPPGGELKECETTDGDWPRIMRVQPLVQWGLRNVWTLLRSQDIKLCELYELGYTSIGDFDLTIRNPILKINQTDYFPAWRLLDDEHERLGRLKKTA